jgi:hypothetical protein
VRDGAGLAHHCASALSAPSIRTKRSVSPSATLLYRVVYLILLVEYLLHVADEAGLTRLHIV